MITVNNILDIADSAMTANTAAMNTVSQNVANVNTPFYNSETPIENEAPAVVGAPYTYGTGVNVDQIQRSTDNFVQSEVNNETGQNSYYTTLYQGLDQIQNLFNDQTGSGFSSQISQFFNDFQNVANNPSNTSQRTALLSDAQSLAGSINNAYTTIKNTVASTNNSIQGLIPEINNLTSQIATLNQQITYAQNAGSNANELQDEQANAINSLSKLVNISYYTNNNGKTNIALGNVPLVSSDDSFNLSTQVDPSNPANLDIMWTGPDGSAQSITSQVTGGSLGAYVNLEQNIAPSYINQLNS
ncbi:MAG: flagellar hook-associated protein FlgK, partial [Candidatus Acidulodesulfobacterium sp.]